MRTQTGHCEASLVWLFEGTWHILVLCRSGKLTVEDIPGLWRLPLGIGHTCGALSNSLYVLASLCILKFLVEGLCWLECQGCTCFSLSFSIKQATSSLMLARISWSSAPCSISTHGLQWPVLPPVLDPTPDLSSRLCKCLKPCLVHSHILFELWDNRDFKHH